MDRWNAWDRKIALMKRQRGRRWAGIDRQGCGQMNGHIGRQKEWVDGQKDRQKRHMDEHG